MDPGSLYLLSRKNCVNFSSNQDAVDVTVRPFLCERAQPASRIANMGDSFTNWKHC